MTAALPAFLALTMTILPCAWPAADAPPPKTGGGMALATIAHWARALALTPARVEALAGGAEEDGSLMVDTADAASASASGGEESGSDEEEGAQDGYGFD